MKPVILLAAASAALSLAACSGGDPVDQAISETAAANQDGVDHAAMGHGEAAATTEADALFADSESVMHREMAEASGATVDESYIAKMIAHHRGAVAMAEVALEQSRDAEIRRMAQAVVDAQTREIAEMQAWRPAESAADPHAGH